MHAQLAALAQASVLQLRDAMRRVTALHTQAKEGEERDEPAFLAGVEVSGSTWAEWEQTNLDVRHIHA